MPLLQSKAPGAFPDLRANPQSVARTSPRFQGSPGPRGADLWRPCPRATLVKDRNRGDGRACRVSARKPFTGGLLNHLNRAAGISLPENSVPVIQLIRAHRPRSAFELETLIARHVHARCWCGLVSRGRVQDFGRALYEAQWEYWGEYRFSLQECTQWEYDLFVHQSIRGDRMEAQAATELSAALAPRALVQMSDVFLDCELHVDLEVLRGPERLAGVQVKPASFFRARRGTQTAQAWRHEALNIPVYILCYNHEGRFLGMPELSRTLLALT